MADARRVSADWQRLAVEQAAVGIVQLGPDGTLWEANPGFCRMLGVAADELLGKSLAERLHPEDVAGWRGWIGRAAAGDVDAYTVEVRALRPSRGVVWLEASVTVARDEDGQMRFCVGVVQDVSARHEAERALRRRVAKFFAAFDAAQVPMTQTDPATGRFERANPPFCELTGYTESELRERTMQQLVHPEESGHEADVSPGFTPEKRYVRKDGAVLWAIRYASPMYHDSGELFRTLSAWVDVSARRRTEDALGLSEARFRTLAEAGPFMVYSSDADGLPSYLSPSLVAYLGLTVAQLRDEDVIRSIVYADDFAHVAALRAPVAAVTTAELRLRRADGEFRWVLARTVSLLDDAGRFVQRIGSLTDIHDRKQAELALAGSEERFRIASEAVDGLIYDLDLTTGHTYRSAGFTTTLGWALDEIAPTAGAWEALIHPDDRDATLERSQAAMAAGLESFALEYRARHKAGHWVDLWDNQRILRDGKGKPLRVVGHSIDVTARKRAEEALRASEARLTALANASPALFWSTTVDGANSWASEAWLRYTGRPVGQPGTWPDLLHPLDAERSLSLWQSALAEESHFVIENRIRRHDGEHRWFLTRAVPLRDESGSVTGWMGASTDIHDLKLAEETLRESEERFRILADEAPVLIWVNGLSGCEFVNRAYREFLGVGDVDVKGDDWARFIHPDDRESYLGEYAGALERQLPFQREFRFRRHDGEYRWMLSTGSPRRNASGELLGYVGSTFDITSHKQAEAALREDDRRKDEFLATLAHELRNPLAPIRNAVEVLRLEPTESPHLEWARDMIDRQVDQLARLVDDLLEVSRITRGMLSLRLERVEVSQLFREVVEASAPSLQQGGHEVRVSLPGETLYLRADPVRLAQVLVNLLDNAAKHSGTKEPIRLSATREGGRVRLSVDDSGRGMSQEETLRVFELFYRAGDRAEHRPGLGVGLALVKSLIELHGGTVEAYSAGLGRGSRFSVYVPVHMADRPLLASDPAPEPTQVAPLRVLVVDDNRDSTESLASLLKMWGHEVETAGDGVEACERAERFRPDVALLDLSMPRLDGYGAARRIRLAPWAERIVLVAQTGWGQASDRRLAEAAGFDFHLTKPLNFVALRKILAEARRAPGA